MQTSLRHSQAAVWTAIALMAAWLLPGGPAPTAGYAAPQADSDSADQPAEDEADGEEPTDAFGEPIEEKEEVGQDADEADPQDADAQQPLDAFGEPIEVDDSGPSADETGGKKTPSVHESQQDLYSTSHHARWLAARRLRDAGAEARPATKALIAALKDKDADVAAMAAEALGAIGAESEDVVPALADALTHKQWVVRWSAAAALGKIGPPAHTADKALIRVINGDRDRDVRDRASRALSKIKGKARKLSVD